MTYNKDRETLVCIDLSVAMHQLEESLLKQPIGNLVELAVKTGNYKSNRAAEIAVLKQLTTLNMDWLYSLDWLGTLKPTNYQVVLLRDWKVNFRIEKGTHVCPEGQEWEYDEDTDRYLAKSLWGYWRHEYLKRLEVAEVLDKAATAKRKRKPRAPKVDAEGNLVEPKAAKAVGVAYKGGRAHATDNFKVIKDKTQVIAENSGWQSIGYPGYEADDIMGALAKLNSELEEPKQLLMVTTDTDWLGLVDDNTYWFCMFGHYPRLRDTSEILAEWSLRRLKVACTAGRQIYDVKATKGDASDNLPGGCPEVIRGVVDLLNPLAEYNLLGLAPVRKELTEVLATTKPPKGADGQRIQGILENAGLATFIRKYQAERDYPRHFTSEVPHDLF